jgi:multicomponent Na+:H+ antiporter subunit A
MGIAVLATLAFAVLAYWPVKRAGAAAGWVAAAIAAAWFGWLLAVAPGVVEGDPVAGSFTWVPGLDIEFSWRVDGLALVMALIIAGVGALVLAYTGAYAEGAKRAKLLSLLTAFVAAMLGLAIADNVLSLFIFWETTSLLSFLLIGIDHEKDDSRRSAQQALLITGGGGLALLGGLILLGVSSGSWEISTLLDEGYRAAGNTGTAALILIALGAFTKSAQFPFHVWLPNAMVAPSPVSAYLHSAAMVKAGVFVLARLQPIFSDLALWQALLVPVGAVTAVVGAWFALRHTDMKKVFAYTTISALGVLVLLLGTGTSAGAKAAVVFLMGHSLYKAALFMAAGAVDHATGTRDLSRLGGLRQRLPGVSFALVLAGLSLAGLPPFLGYLGKETLLAATVDAGAGSAILTATAVVVAILSLVIAAVACLRPVFSAPPGHLHDHAPPWPLWAAPAILAVAGLALGAVGPLLETFVASAAAPIAGKAVDVKLGLVPQEASVAILSIVTIGIGLVLAGGALWRGWSLRGPRLAEVSEAAYDASLAGLLGAAQGTTRLVQSGSLPRYLLIIILTAIGLVGVPLVVGGAMDFPRDRGDARGYEIVIGMVILAGALVAASFRPGIAAAAALGVVGLGIALLYAFLGAPDLAMTQVLIETLTVVLFVFVFSRFPQMRRLSRPPARVRDIAVALTAGMVVTVLVWSVGSSDGPRPLTAYFGETSSPLAFGKNVVNVILVDFRALDTLGEITVLAVAASGVIALLRLGRGRDQA